MKKETIKKMVFWSFVSAGLIALFWMACYFLTGSVPVADKIQFSKEISLDLPFNISRWWDILLGPFFSLYLVYLWSSAKEKDCTIGVVITGMIIGVIMGSGVISGNIERPELLNLLFIFGLYGVFDILFEGEDKQAISAMSPITYLMTVGLIIGTANMLPTILILMLLAGIITLLTRKSNTKK